MKNAVVTGSTKGIGYAIAKVLLADGYFVFMNYAADDKAAGRARRELAADFAGCFEIIKRPLMTQADVTAFHSEVVGKVRGIDLLVCNVATTDRTAWREMSWEQWNNVMNVNLNAPAALVRAFDPHINMGGGILFIGAIMGIYAHAVSIPYSVSKAGVHALTKALVKEYCGRNIRVNAIAPGFVDTPWQTEKPIDQKNRICDKISLGRFATPQEIADIALNVIHCTYLNGAVIEADGGYCYR